MKRFTSVCIDKKTKYEMILSECSFNMACDYLINLFHPEENEFLVRTDYKKELHFITIQNKEFAYDEIRGYLMLVQ